MNYMTKPRALTFFSHTLMQTFTPVLPLTILCTARTLINGAEQALYHVQ